MSPPQANMALTIMTPDREQLGLQHTALSIRIHSSKPESKVSIFTKRSEGLWHYFAVCWRRLGRYLRTHVQVRVSGTRFIAGPARAGVDASEHLFMFIHVFEHTEVSVLKCSSTRYSMRLDTIFRISHVHIAQHAFFLPAQRPALFHRG